VSYQSAGKSVNQVSLVEEHYSVHTYHLSARFSVNDTCQTLQTVNVLNITFDAYRHQLPRYYRGNQFHSRGNPSTGYSIPVVLPKVSPAKPRITAVPIIYFTQWQCQGTAPELFMPVTDDPGHSHLCSSAHGDIIGLLQQNFFPLTSLY